MFVLMAAATSLLAAEEPKIALAQEPPKNFRAGEIQFETFGVHSRPDLTGAPQWGVGIGMGYYITRGLGVSVRGVSYATDNWGGATVDEGDLRLNFRAPLWDRIAPYAYCQGVHNFDSNDWGAGAGGGLEFKFNKNFGVFGETGINVTTEGKNDWTTSAGIRMTF